MKNAAFIYSNENLKYDFGPNHPLKPIRLRKTHELVHEYGLLSRSDSMEIAPRPADDAEVLAVHDEALLNTIKLLSAGKTVHGAASFGFGISDNPPFPGMYEASLLYSGGSILAGQLVSSQQAHTAFNPSGGLHHAMRDHASGFCILNDAAIAIRTLMDQYDKIVYLDIDAHHGDGVQAAFYDTSQVMTISLHESGQFLFPGTGFVDELGSGEGVGYSVNVPLRPYTDDEIYLWAFHEVVPPLIESYDPELIVFQIGADAHYQDPLAHMNLTTRSYEEIFQYVMSLGKPILALGGGGYHIEAVPRIWTLAYASFLQTILPDEIPVSYSEAYGVHQLRDKTGPKLWSSDALEISEYAEKTVEKIKELIFPVHKIHVKVG